MGQSYELIQSGRSAPSISMPAMGAPSVLYDEAALVQLMQVSERICDLKQFYLHH